MNKLEEVLIKEFGTDLKENKDFRYELWSALSNIDWVHHDGTQDGFSFREAGGFIADVSEEGDYLTYYMMSPVGVVSENIKTRMEKHGWNYTEL